MPNRRLLSAAMVAAVVICGVAGCRARRGVVPRRRPAAVVPTPVPAAPPLDYTRIHPNEVGRIPVLMYHAVGGPSVAGLPRYDRFGLNIRPETFRKQLALMYAAGWYPVNMRDAVTSHIDVPAGKTPVVITFDDARGSQFHYRKDGSVDPDCAVAILDAFHRKHPDWPLRGTFYVMGESKWNPVPFYQEHKDREKLQHLLRDGFEIANHSTSHRLFHHLDPATERWELAECVRYVKARAPEATMDTFALPGGSVPRSHAGWEALMYGRDGGTVYRNKAVLLAWGGPTEAPAARGFDPWRIKRIGAEPGNIEYWIKHLKRGSAMQPYVSDGDPNTVVVPRSAEKLVNAKRLDGARLAVYDDGSQPTKLAKTNEQ